MVAAGAFMSIIVSKTASRGQTAYANAATVVEQTIGSIRTVCQNLRRKYMPENLNFLSTKCVL